MQLLDDIAPAPLRVSTHFFVPSAQKNPHAIRLAEERRGLEQLTMSAAVNLSRASQLSSHIHNMCSEAREAIYTREADVKHWLDKGRWSPHCCSLLKRANVQWAVRAKCLSFGLSVCLLSYPSPVSLHSLSDTLYLPNTVHLPCVYHLNVCILVLVI